MAYKAAPLNNSQLDDAAKPFLPNLNTSSLNSTEQAESRNLTGALLSIGQSNLDLNFTISFKDGPMQFTLKENTTDIGEFDEFVPFGNLTTHGVPDGNATGIFVPGNVTSVEYIANADTQSAFLSLASHISHADVKFSRKCNSLFRTPNRPNNSLGHRRHPPRNSNLLPCRRT